MRLVIDGQRLTARRTGVGRCLESLLHEWAASGWPLDEVRLVARDAAGLATVPTHPNLRVVVAGTNLPGLVWENLVLRRQLREGDLLFAPANLVPLTWRGPTVLVLYDTLPWSVPDRRSRWRFGWRYRLAARRASQIVVPSKATAAEVARVHGVDPARLTLAYPGPEPGFHPRGEDDSDVRAARSSLGLGNAPYFLFVGKRSARRHVPELLAAFRLHRGRWPDHRLVFVGPGGGTPLPQAEPGIVDAGHVAESMLHGLVASALTVVYPSDWEGFGLPVVEALASGTPILTLRNSALAESGGDAACYADRPEPAAMAAAMDLLARDPAHRATVVARGLEHVRRFTRRGFADGVTAAIRAVASGATASGS